MRAFGLALIRDLCKVMQPHRFSFCFHCLSGQPSLVTSLSLSISLLSHFEAMEIPENQYLSLKHPVLPDGSLGTVRPVCITPVPACVTLTTFIFFPNLPQDLRIYIWRLAMPRERIVSVYEQIDWPDCDDCHNGWEALEECDSGYCAEGHDGNLRAIQMLDRFLHRCLVCYRGYFSNEDQSQLEDYGFTSPRPKPELPTNAQLDYAARCFWQRTRKSIFITQYPMPVLLQVCQESRNLLQAYGYELAFSTRTAPAQTWFNFSSDFLYLRNIEHYDDLEHSESLDGGYWNIGQFSSRDLSLVKKLALYLPREDYVNGGPLPRSLHMAVQLFGNLQELLLVEDDVQRERRDRYWRNGCEQGEAVAVDMDVEELWGHCPEWNPGPRNPWNWEDRSRGFADSSLKQSTDPFAEIKRDIEERLRNRKALLDNGKREWQTPKVRCVTIMPPREVHDFVKSREAFRWYMNKMYWEKVDESRKGWRAASAFDLQYGDDVQMEEECFRSSEPSLDPRELEWYDDARKALYGDGEWSSPYIAEWAEASEAMLDMDSWPWAEE
jgi:hypothetical protein